MGTFWLLYSPHSIVSLLVSCWMSRAITGAGGS